MAASWLGLEGKVAVVTGAASGIGKAVAQEFLDNGAIAVVCDINPNVPEFKPAPGTLEYVNVDVTKRESIAAMVDFVMEKYVKIDILVNNAGINIPRLLVDKNDPRGQFELDERVWDRVMGINLKGVYMCAQECGRVMVDRGEGVIINMSSECGLEGSEGQSVYAATKGAVNALTRSWAKEMGKLGIRVVGVAPGILEATGLRTLEYETALAYTRNITVDDLRAGYSKTSTTPLGRSGRLTEVADLVNFLASDRASFICGTTINVAGGKTRG